jgi:hypothetical protein
VAKFNNPVAWVGVVMVHDDGSTYAVELDGKRQRITWEINREFEFDENWESGWVEREPTGWSTVDIHIQGYGKDWRDGHRAAHRPAAINAGTPAITQDPTVSVP